MPPTELANPTFMFTWCTIKEQAKVTPMLSQCPASELPHQKMITNQALHFKIEEELTNNNLVDDQEPQWTKG